MLTICRLTVIIFIINIVLILYTTYVFYYKFSDQSSDPSHIRSRRIDNSFEQLSRYGDNAIDDYINENEFKTNASIESIANRVNTSALIPIEIWSKASIGLYLWQHILRANLENKVEPKAYLSGSLKTERFKFKFRSGPLLTTDSLQHLTTQNLILVLNGRDKHKIEFATNWIKAVDRVKETVKNVGLIVLGDEQCRNNWLRPYLQPNGGLIKFLFIVYDWKSIDNKVIHQWPLGVAAYRNFPNPSGAQLNWGTTRPYVCNFIATIYPDSSRLELLSILEKKYEKICIIKGRFEWQPKETIDSLNYYIESLRLSDLTLSPIGMNHECYRIFEAMAFGSVPVIEENVKHVMKTSCDTRSAYRLLKEHKAPVIVVTNWTKQLSDILDNELNLSIEYKIQRRLRLIEWYSEFKTIIRNEFFRVINEKFV